MRYDTRLRWIEDAEARRAALVMHVPNRPDQDESEPDQILRWINTVRAQIAIHGVRLSSLVRTTR